MTYNKYGDRQTRQAVKLQRLRDAVADGWFILSAWLCIMLVMGGAAMACATMGVGV